jgi:predicted phosphodiesterase
MTPLRILSDLHFEFHADDGRSFVESLNPSPDEILVCAGDLTSGHRLPAALNLLCDAFREVVYVAGNHEFYGSTRAQVERWIAEVVHERGNFTALDYGDKAEIDGVRFVGCPLWFSRNLRAPRAAMNDFRLIRDFESWVYEENARCVEFLRREVQAGDVVVTHYLPSHKSVSPQWRGSPLNAFFVCDVEHVIADARPALWVHGHTHDSLDYRIGDTRIICNPFGYLHHEENPKFQRDLVVDMPAWAKGLDG